MNIKAYIRLMRFDKPIGIFLLLWPTMWALFLASKGYPSVKNLLIFIFGVIIMRAAGCIINDIADRKIDKLVARTKSRPITAGEISVKNALVLFFILIGIAFVLVLMTNWLTIKLAIIAVILASLYPFTKRIINLPQLILGLAFAMSIPMAFAAEVNYLNEGVLWLFIANTVWTLIYDTMYAMTDIKDDIKIGVKSSAILFGKYDKVILLWLQIILLFLFIKIGLTFQLNLIYFFILIIVIMLMFYHQFLIKNREPQNCFKAFLNNNYIGFAIFLAIAFSLWFDIK